ncbi:MAG TPA: AAA family ATPase, partial [Polyangiales bacterium]|nr:AAA family ATPase [Polyangiales bacterium]
MSLLPPPAREEIIQGAVEQLIYQTRDGAFSVVRFLREADNAELTVVGDLGNVQLGETLRVRGRFVDHPTHGRRFQVHTFTPVLPSSREGMTRYLSSGLIPGIGKKLAQRLVLEFGEQALDVIANQSAKLRSVPGVGKARAQAIASAVRERRDEAELMSYLHGLGLGPAMARKLRKQYGERAVQVIRADPYLVAEQVEGVGFRTADSIGRASGLALDDPRRAAGAVLHLLAQAADQGHSYSTVELLADAGEALGIPPDKLEEAIEALTGRDMLVRDGDAVYATPLHRAEVAVARMLSERAQHDQPPRITPDESELGDLSEEQAEAVRATFRGRLLIITGGPGTGKTTTVRGIVAAHRAAGHDIVLCAPTGRAAKRLSEAAGSEARTIHRLLEWNPATARFQRGRNAPVEGDLVLVDEASMLNLQLAERLFAAIPLHVPLVLVGDVDQLPPVGPGQVLRATIDSGVARVVRLSTVFRQAQESKIVAGAHAILAGRVPDPTPSGTRGTGDLFVVRTREPETTLARLKEMMVRLPIAYGIDPKRDVMVLSPMRKGPLGTERLNEFLQGELNPGERSGNGEPRPGDRVMQLRNDYEKEAFNGDLVEVRTVEGGITYVMLDGRDVKYRREDLGE